MRYDWKPGDLALCVRNSHRDDENAISAGWEVQPGAVYTVTDVWFVCAAPPGVGLWLAEDTCTTPDAAWDARDFRKLEEHIPDAEDAETIRLLTGKPVKEPAA